MHMIQPPQNKVQWRVLVNAGTNLRIPQKGKNYFNSRDSIISSRWTVLLGVSNTKRVTSK